MSEPEWTDAPKPEPEPSPEPIDDEDEAEAEEAEDAPAEPEPEGMSEAEIEAIHKKLEALQKHVSRRMGEILGEDAQFFELCEVCTFSQTPGWRPSGPLPPEVVTAVRAALGQRGARNLKADPHSRTCPECDGEGDVETGSKVPEWLDMPCVNCKGRGWEATDEARSGGSPSLVNGSAALETAPMATDRLAPTPENVPPEVEALRARGYVVVPPALPVG